MTKKQRANAGRIVMLANAFGHLVYNKYGQTPESSLNLSIPCARLIIAGVVTGIADTNDGVNDNAVADVERLCRAAVAYTTAAHGKGWWTEAASLLGIAQPAPAVDH